MLINTFALTKREGSGFYEGSTLSEMGSALWLRRVRIAMPAWGPGIVGTCVIQLLAGNVLIYSGKRDDAAGLRLPVLHRTRLRWRLPPRAVVSLAVELPAGVQIPGVIPMLVLFEPVSERIAPKCTACGGTGVVGYARMPCHACGGTGDRPGWGPPATR